MTGSRILQMVVAVGLAAGTAQAQDAAGSAGCAVTKQGTSCNLAAFKSVLGSAELIAVEYGAMDRPIGTQLKELVAKLGKRVATGDEQGDLTLTVAPVNNAGVNIGPADEVLVELRVFSGPSSQGRMIWLESYRGQADKPWPANVHFAIEQFLDQLKK